MTGLLLLSGGRGRRMGGPKHDLAHPGGRSWGGHLVGVFEGLWPDGPITLLGEGLSDRPELQVLDDRREGPAAALITWCSTPAPPTDRWWIVACDQIRWTQARLADWLQRVAAADPEAAHWVLAEHGGHLQPLGGFLPSSLRPTLAGSKEASLTALAQSVPHIVLKAHGPEWLDLDTPEDRRAFDSGI